MAIIYLAGGCFWGTQKYVSLIKGVFQTEVGYANGNTENPTYEQVCYENTGHAEVVKVEYNDKIISLSFLLELFYQSIDPTSINRQGGDRGVQYRTGIYYENDADLPIIQQSISSLQNFYDKPIAIEVTPLENYSKAEPYHQNYLDKNPQGYCHIGRREFEKAKNAIIDPSAYTKKNKEELKSTLPPISYEVTMKNATEPPFKNEFHNHFEDGVYVDITTGEPLFSSEDKFDSHCGWPSFSKPIDPNTMREKSDKSYNMIRTEVRSRVGDAHLGHLFNDGPNELGGMRYCINSASLRFIPREDMEKEGYGYLLK